MAHTDRDVFDKAGQYNLEELTILSYVHDSEEGLPVSIDIKGVMLNFEIAEDVFSNNIVGSVIVYDMQDIRTILPITGLERLALKFNSPGTPGYDFSEENGIPLQIYKVDKVKIDPQQEKAQFYQIFFCSPEMYNNKITRISKAYAGPVENGINDIIRNYLKSEKPFYFEPTATNPKIVIPNLNPYEAIRLLAKSAVPSKFPENAGYVFYETSQGFYFRSFASMMAVGGLGASVPPKWRFQKMINAITENAKQPEIKDVERRLSSVIRYEYGKPVDALENITQGFYANKVVSHDAFNKTITTTNFDYIEKGKLQPHTEMSQEAGLLYPEKVEYSDTRKPLNEMFDSKLMVKADTKKIHNDYEDNAVGGLGARTNQLAGFRNHNLSLLVYGNTLLNAGDIITFTTPVLRPGEDGDDNINPYTSGRYVIMAMKHTVNTEAQRHEMVLKCYKDSVRSAYPTEEEALSNIGKADIKDYDIYEEQLKEFGGGVDF